MATTKQASLSTCTKEINSAKKVANNTFRIVYQDGSIAYRFHKTDIVTIKNNGSKVLNSGGWKTVTTKDRINAYCPFKISQLNHLWTVTTPKGKYDFFDGMEILTDGTVVNPIHVNMKKVEKTKKDIDKFVSLITKDNLPNPGNGDCWDCLMIDKDGKTMGDMNGSQSHLISHMKEKYVVGILLVNAMREAGYSDMQISTHYGMKWADSFKRAVKKYMIKRLIK